MKTLRQSLLAREAGISWDNARMDMGQWLACIVLVISLCMTLTWSDQPWSPVVGGKALIAPVISTPQLLVHTSLPAPDLSVRRYEQKPFMKKRVIPPHRRRELYYRRKYRRRRRYWKHPRTRYRRVRSHNFIPTHREDNFPRVEGRGARHEEGRSFVRNFRNLFGAPEHCLEEGRQYSCTFAPVCWLTGGVATPGTSALEFDASHDTHDMLCSDTVRI